MHIGLWWVNLRERGGERRLGRARRRCVDNIKMDLQEMGWGHELNLSASV